MPSYVFPKRATEFVFPIGLISQADNNVLITNPTIAAGDWLVTSDFNAFTQLDTLPSVNPAGGTCVMVTVSIAEMTADNIFVVWEDVAGAEWASGFAIIQSSLRQVDDIPTTAEIADGVWDETLADHVAAGSTGEKLDDMCCMLGEGATSYTYTVTNSVTGLPIQGVVVTVTTDIAGTNAIATGTTDVSGEIDFWLDPATYYMWSFKSGYTFTNPDTEVVV